MCVDGVHLLVGFYPRPREGATRQNDKRNDGINVSIRAPVKGRPGVYPPRPARHGFYPRPREGATASQCRAGPGLPPVSIRAPVKGRRANLYRASIGMMFLSAPP